MTHRLPMALAALAFALALPVEGACKEHGVMVFPPPGSVVPQNSRFILEGVGSEQARVESLVGRELILRGEKDVVTVRVIPGWKSAAHRVAVQLVPNSQLKAGQRYVLMFDAAMPGFALLNEGADSISWFAGSEVDQKAPSYELKPAISEGVYRSNGKQLARFLEIHTRLVEDGPAYFLITLQRARGSTETQKYYVPLKSGVGHLGHDECSGSFTFDDGRAYRATIEVFDAAGNAGPKLPKLELHAPKPGAR